MTKLSDLGPPPITGTRHGGPPKHEPDHFVLCSVCGQAIDMRDLRQVFWHDVPKHEPLELDS